MSERAIRDAMIEVGRRIWIKGFVAANDGNLSVRLGPDRYLVTATGSIKGFLSAADLVIIDGRGRLVEGERQPSSEILMHLAIYEARDDVRAVTHAHPPTATGFATAGVELDQCVLPEIVVTLGAVPTVPYGTPSTRELADAVGRHAAAGNACLLANHGAVSWGRDLFEAYHHMERVEHFARILLTARLLGNVQVMTEEQVGRLLSATGQVAEPVRCRRCGAEVAAGVECVTCLPDGGPRASSGGGETGSSSPDVDPELIDAIVREVRKALREGAD